MSASIVIAATPAGVVVDSPGFLGSALRSAPRLLAATAAAVEIFAAETAMDTHPAYGHLLPLDAGERPRSCSPRNPRNPEEPEEPEEPLTKY
jgi:hypothetical protein